jgi:hypothetical protein
LEVGEQFLAALLRQLARDGLFHGTFHRMRDGFPHKPDGLLEPVVQFLQFGVPRNRPAQQLGLVGGQFPQQQRGEARLDLFA